MFQVLLKTNHDESVADKIKYSINEDHEVSSIGDKIFSNTELKIYKEQTETNETILVKMNKSCKTSGKSIIIIL